MYVLTVMFVLYLGPILLFFTLFWLHERITRMPARRRSGDYAAGFIVWFLIIATFWTFYPAVNRLAWQNGMGDRLVERPWAAVHHRLLGFHDWLKDVSDPTWQQETHEKRAQAPEMLSKAATLLTGSYFLSVVLPVEFLIRGWSRRSRLPERG